MSGPVSPFVPWLAGEELVLASRSPRRAELLQVAGIPFTVVPPGDVEALHAPRLQAASAHPGAYAEALAAAKAKDVAGGHPGRLVLGADTIVLLDDDILEKPADEDEAFRLLSRLAGRRHTVITSLALVDGAGPDPDEPLVAHERTGVEFLPLDPGQIREYIATGEPMDKAGAYGIQGYGALMVAGIEGCYFNVMGLPLARLGAMLRAVLAARGGAQEKA